MSDLGKDILSKASFAASLGLLIWFSISQFSHVVKGKTFSVKLRPGEYGIAINW